MNRFSECEDARRRELREYADDLVAAIESRKLAASDIIDASISRLVRLKIEATGREQDRGGGYPYGPVLTDRA